MKLIKDKKIIMIVLSIILVIIVMSSTTYALFFKTHTLDNTESYTAGILDITVEEGSKLSLTNTLPMPDEEGAKTTPYTFTITNNGNISYTFDLKMLSTTTSNQINSKYIKVKLDDNEPVLLSSFSSGIIADDLKLDPGKSVTMSVRIWLDINTPNTEIGKKFSAKIVTDGIGSEYVLVGADYIESLLPDNPTTMNNDDPDGNVRYMGTVPNNYVRFNNELWRILGVFDVKSSETGNTEKRIKIIRDESIGNMAWDSGNINDWSKASLQTYLNGDYYNSLTSEAKELVGDTYWNLGGVSSSSTPLAVNFYRLERETSVYSGRPWYWIGKIGLMYFSDYPYSTSGGSVTSRQSCLSQELSNWSAYSDCKNNSYLYESSLMQWTLTPDSINANWVFFVHAGGYNGYQGANGSFAYRPVVYLKSTVQITGGDGTKENPYILG